MNLAFFIWLFSLLASEFQALNMYDGAVVLVSHDERLITTVCTDLWVCGGGKVEPFNGDFEDYKKSFEDEALVQ